MGYVGGHSPTKQLQKGIAMKRSFVLALLSVAVLSGCCCETKVVHVPMPYTAPAPTTVNFASPTPAAPLVTSTVIWGSQHVTNVPVPKHSYSVTIPGYSVASRRGTVISSAGGGTFASTNYSDDAAHAAILTRADNAMASRNASLTTAMNTVTSLDYSVDPVFVTIVENHCPTQMPSRCRSNCSPNRCGCSRTPGPCRCQ